MAFLKVSLISGFNNSNSKSFSSQCKFASVHALTRLIPVPILSAMIVASNVFISIMCVSNSFIILVLSQKHLRYVQIAPNNIKIYGSLLKQGGVA